MTEAARRPAPVRMVLATLAGLMLAAGLATLVYTVATVYRFHVVLPLWDEWLTVEDIRRFRAGTYGLADLLRQHHEHRLLLPRLFFLVDDVAFGMSDRFNLAAMFAFQAADAAILVRLMARRTADRALRLGFAGFVLLGLFSLRQETNLTIGFQLQFTGIFTLAMAAAVVYVDALDRLGTFGGRVRPGAWWRIGTAGLLSAAATFTMANGVLCGFVLLILALALRAPWRVSLATGLAAAGLAALFFHGYVRDPLDLPAADALADPWRFPRFLAALLGNPIGENLVATQLFGAAGLAAFAAAALSVTVRRVRDPAAVALVAIMGFAVASDLAATYGRVSVGIMQAYEDRYVETAMLFWCALVAFWAPGLLRSRPRLPALAGAAALALAAALIAGRMALAEVGAWHDLAAQAARMTAFRDSLLAGLYDDRAGAYEIFDRTDLEPQIGVLRAQHLSLFALPEAADLGRPIGAVGAPAPASACTGTVTATADPATLGADGVRLDGTAWDVAADRPVRRLLAAGPDGAVVGFGSLDKPGTRGRSWAAVARAAPGTTLSAYAVLEDGRVCDLGRSVVASR